MNKQIFVMSILKKRLFVKSMLVCGDKLSF